MEYLMVQEHQFIDNRLVREMDQSGFVKALLAAK